MQKIILILCCVFFSCAQEKKESINLLTPVEFKELISVEKDIQLIDVRTPEEWGLGVIKGAQKINFFDDNFKTSLKKLNKNKTVAVYCKSGGRSGKTAKLLLDLGFKKIYDLKGGYLNWNTNKE